MDLAAIDHDIAAAFVDGRRDPFSVDWTEHRHVAGRRAIRDLEAESPGALRDGLLAAIAWLTVLRVSQPASQKLDEARKKARVTVHLEHDVDVGWRELVSGMLAARSAGEARAHFVAWPTLADALRGLENALREARREAFHQLGIEDVAERFLGIERAHLASIARELLARTEELARERTHSSDTWPLDLDVRLARGAKDGWPARLTWRSSLSLLPGLDVRADLGTQSLPPECPRAFGAASFARAFEAIGVAFRRASSPPSVPFVQREPPLHVDAWRTGHVFAAVLGEPAFHVRVLGLAQGRARDQARTMSTAFLVHARMMALRVASSERGADVEALTALAFGEPLAASMRGVWPSCSDDDLARFVALLTVTERIDALRNREGDDWFRNPRAFATLRDLVQAPVESKPDTAQVIQRFEELLG